MLTDSDESYSTPIKQSNDVNEPSEPTPPDMDDWLQDIRCMGKSVTSSQHVVVNKISRYLHSTPMDQELTLLL